MWLTRRGRGRVDARDSDDPGRNARRQERGKTGDADLLRQRTALGDARSRHSALPENADAGQLRSAPARRAVRRDHPPATQSGALRAPCGPWTRCWRKADSNFSSLSELVEPCTGRGSLDKSSLGRDRGRTAGFAPKPTFDFDTWKVGVGWKAEIRLD